MVSSPEDAARQDRASRTFGVHAGLKENMLRQYRNVDVTPFDAAPCAVMSPRGVASLTLPPDASVTMSLSPMNVAVNNVAGLR